MKSASRVLARGLLGAGVLVGVATLLSARVLYEGERELRTAEALASADKLEEACVHARTAAAWYVPGAPHVPAAYARLIAIARLAEGRGDPATALVAWHSVRSASLSSRWARIPHSEELALADASIARLSARQPQPQSARLQDPAELQQEQHALLARREAPRLPWVIALLLGFGALCFGLIHMGVRGFEKSGRLEGKRLVTGAAVAGAGLVAWCTALFYS